MRAWTWNHALLHGLYLQYYNIVRLMSSNDLSQKILVSWLKNPLLRPGRYPYAPGSRYSIIVIEVGIHRNNR